MNAYVAFLLFTFIIVLYWVISELFTILFRLTGLPDEKARFQVISLLTGSGFTTRESEIIVSSRTRRRLAAVTMLFGYVFNITIVSALVNIFMSLNVLGDDEHIFGIFIPITTVAAIFVFMRIPAVRAFTDHMLERLAGRLMNKSGKNTVMILDQIGKGCISQVRLKEIPPEYDGKALKDMDLRTDKNILVMLIEHTGKLAEPASAETVFRTGDKLTVFGNYSEICRTFNANERFEDV
ncbi:MAG: TrkA C-terminal domain-containing protein [Oscillospiraceae bacterium]|nr:TrkA C-terminal domain-containing protein [Oscillospiraceae bacterium]